MISQAQYFNIIAIVIATCAVAVGQQSKESASINIPLNKGITWANKELYSDFIHVNRSSTVQVVFTDVNKNVSFVIFQVHSHLYNITVSNNYSFVLKSYISGTNVGLYSSVKPRIDTFYIKNPNSDVDLNLFISVHGYMSKDPIPGGCNQEAPIPVSPFMFTYFQKDFIFVNANAAKRYGEQVCVYEDSVNVDFFMMYLPERNFEEETYFDGIRNMMTLEKIRENGNRIPRTKYGKMRRLLSAYPGTGSVYVAVASDVNSPDCYSIYVPTHNYACSPVTDDGCELIDDILSRFICASLLFVGVFMCYFGHRFFKTEMFLFGMLSGVVITYILISLMSDLERPALLSAAVLSGVFFGAIWLTFWWFYGIPVIAVLIPALNMGFLMSSVIYNKLPGDLMILQEDFNFWTLFILIMLLTSMILVSVAFVSNIPCCAVLGAYAVVYPIDFYLGSNLKYLVINTIRRATVPKFSRAVLMPPFEWRDAMMIVLWVALAVSGFLFQHYQNRNRPPFPPPPRSVRPGVPEGSIYGALPTTRNFIPTIHVSSPVVVRSLDERTPLLS